MNYFAVKVRFYDEISKSVETEYHVVGADKMADAIQRIANYYDEVNLLDVKVSYLHDDVCQVDRECYNKLLEERD